MLITYDIYVRLTTSKMSDLQKSSTPNEGAGKLFIIEHTSWCVYLRERIPYSHPRLSA